MNGVPLPIVARRLGHSNVRTTMRYAYVSDREIEAAAECVGQTVGTMTNLWSEARSGNRETGRACSSVTSVHVKRI